MDESGFLLVPSVRRTWAPCGQTPMLVHRYARDKISAISAVTVSPVRHRLGLYCHFHFVNLTQFEVAAFLRLLLRQLRGPIMLLWDGGPIHRGPAVSQVLARHPRLMVERFPAYAPELNPDEQVWNHFKTQLANGCPLSIDQLLDDLSQLARRARRSSQLLRSFVLESDLPPLFSP
ncbi:MAG: transposase [Candidatus Binataceae bacterium]